MLTKIDFIKQSDVHLIEKVTYGQYVCDHCHLKPEPNRVRIIVGGDKLIFDIDTGTPATNLTEFKLLLKSVISEATYGARFLSCDLEGFFLASLIQQP